MRFTIGFLSVFGAFLAVGCGGTVSDGEQKGDASSPVEGGVCAAKAPTVPVGCDCPSGTVCVSKPQSGGRALIGCVAVPAACEGKPTCACMGCLCGDLGLTCDDVEEDHGTGYGTDLHCH